MLDTELIKAAEGTDSRLMILIHGLGDSMEGYRWVPEAMRMPSMNYLLVNAPDDYYGGFSWYDIYNNPGPGIERSRKMLFELLDSAREKKFPTEKTIVLGFSQGCLMSLEIAGRYPHRLAGIVGISGYAHEPEKMVLELSPVAREQRLLVTHGTQDPLIPIDQVRPQMEVLKRTGLKIQWREFVKTHTIAGEQEMAVIRDFVQQCYVA
ncbi:MAG TPA: alpha/beta fold hydrolase [Verrucomicrobiae bacterium]|jgi:phospholipase/carboxylesterase|nr:alpha/beta fold hydrolase [Verrucomicrobiae bacterium]